MKIKDLPNENNAYKVFVYFDRWEYDWDYNPGLREWVIVDSMLAPQILQSEVVLDEFNQGQEIEIAIPARISRFRNPLPEKLEMNCVVETYTDEAGKYFISLQEQQSTGTDPFSEPVFLKTNIKNGLGIFAGYAVSDTTVFQFDTTR